MPISTVQKFPHKRTLLPRTRLAYVHLRNLLTDAKRDRGARIAGYVAIWLPEELIMLYMMNGELINATRCDGREWRAVSIAGALSRVPPEPEYGEICFCEAEPEQIDCMYHSQTASSVNWPERFVASDPVTLFPYLGATTFDGMLEIVVGDSVNYAVFVNGLVSRSYLCGRAVATPYEMNDHVGHLFTGGHGLGEVKVRRWGEIPEVGVQAPPALVQAYKELASGLVGTLVNNGRASAPAIAEHARQALLETYPVLDGLTLSDKPAKGEIVADSFTLTAGIAAWLREVMWTAVDHDSIPPEQLLKELTWDRRHMFQSAGLYEQIPWKVL
jgi:hypothetical protein